MKILFLCSNLADYLYKCIRYVQEDPQVDIKVVHRGVKQVAPFEFGKIHGDFQEKKDIENLASSCLNFEPDLCYVAGWIDKDYLKIARKLRQAGTFVIIGIDTPWQGKLGQWIRVLSSRFFLLSSFDAVWAAGKRQFFYARKLGFRPEQIIDGLYIADTSLYASGLNDHTSKVLLYAGRLEKIKGLSLLYNVFSSLTEKERNGWSLRIVGNGSLRKKLTDTDHIAVHGFLQPADLAQMASSIGAFILPSHYEPWGVVVQEFASAGMPLIVSSEVNAKEEYVIHNYNGFIFRAGNESELKKVLVQLFDLDIERITQMGSRSKILSARNTKEIWKAKLLSLHK